MIIVSALSLSLRDKEREREKREIELDKNVKCICEKKFINIFEDHCFR